VFVEFWLTRCGPIRAWFPPLLRSFLSRGRSPIPRAAASAFDRSVHQKRAGADVCAIRS
jgi:hypothetical protein